MIFRKYFARRKLRAQQARLDEQLGARRIIFVHVPKCGGTSVTSHFKRALGCIRLDEGKRQGDWYELVERAKTARFVTGHFGAETLAEIRGDAFVFTILREPFSRLRSQYNYLLAVEKAGERSYIRGMTFAEYIETYSGDNVMARQFAKSVLFERTQNMTHDEILERALSVLASVDAIGFQETLPASIRQICKAAGVVDPEDKLPSKLKMQLQPEAQVEPAGSPACLELDYRLYEFAKGLPAVR